MPKLLIRSIASLLVFCLVVSPAGAAAVSGLSAIRPQMRMAGPVFEEQALMLSLAAAGGVYAWNHFGSHAISGHEVFAMLKTYSPHIIVGLFTAVGMAVANGNDGGD